MSSVEPAGVCRHRCVLHADVATALNQMSTCAPQKCVFALYIQAKTIFLKEMRDLVCKQLATVKNTVYLFQCKFQPPGSHFYNCPQM